MEIIVNDTNIFIDLHSIGLLSALCDLPYDVRTVDFVVNEIKDQAQAESLATLVGEGKIKVESFNIDELVAQNIIDAGIASQKLRKLININVRLPKSEIEKRIKKWSNT